MRRIVVTWNDVLKELGAIPERDWHDITPNRIDPTSSEYIAGDAFGRLVERIPPEYHMAGVIPMPGNASATVFEAPDEAPQ